MAGSLHAPAVVLPCPRIVCATDWTNPAVAAAILAAYARLFSPEDPTELVFAVPHKPAERDLRSAQQLMDTLGLDPNALAALTIESFDEVVAGDHGFAVVPEGDPEGLVFDVASAVTWLHDVRAILDHAAAGEAVEPGAPADPAALRERLAGFKDIVVSPPAPVAAPAPAPVAHRATYVGNDRLLVSTNWGGKLFMSASDLSLTPEVVHDGNYDGQFTKFVENFLRPGDVAFDIGANVGLFTVLMGQIVGASGHVVAYEADPDNKAFVDDNVTMNYYASFVEVHGKAAAATHGTLPFYKTTRFRGNGSTLPHDEAYKKDLYVDGHELVEVPAEPLDVHLGRFERIRLVKIDVEGAEEQVLAGMQGLLDSGAVELVSFELLRPKMPVADFDSLVARLERQLDAGWTLWKLDGESRPRRLSLEECVEVGGWSQVLLAHPETRFR